jgi:lipoprotein LprG
MDRNRLGDRGALAPRLLRSSFIAALLALAIVVAACGSSNPSADPTTLLQQAKAKADATQSVHFALSSSNAGTSGTNITAGEGDLARPDQMQGSFTVTLDGFNANIKVATKGGVFEALLPFSSHYVVTNPANYGLTNPAQLLNRTNGLTKLLSLAQHPQSTKQVRRQGELLDTVTYQVPGSAVPVLPDANPSQPVTVVVAINPKTSEMRQVTLVGPFISHKYDTTYIVTLTNYDEQVTITLPPTS